MGREGLVIERLHVWNTMKKDAGLQSVHNFYGEADSLMPESEPVMREVFQSGNMREYVGQRQLSHAIDWISPQQEEFRRSPRSGSQCLNDQNHHRHRTKRNPASGPCHVTIFSSDQGFLRLRCCRVSTFLSCPNTDAYVFLTASSHKGWCVYSVVFGTPTMSLLHLSCLSHSLDSFPSLDRQVETRCLHFILLLSESRDIINMSRVFFFSQGQPTRCKSSCFLILFSHLLYQILLFLL